MQVWKSWIACVVLVGCGSNSESDLDYENLVQLGSASQAGALSGVTLGGNGYAYVNHNYGASVVRIGGGTDAQSSATSTPCPEFFRRREPFCILAATYFRHTAHALMSSTSATRDLHPQSHKSRVAG